LGYKRSFRCVFNGESIMFETLNAKWFGL
jgi:hypothetical protein